VDLLSGLLFNIRSWPCLTLHPVAQIVYIQNPEIVLSCRCVALRAPLQHCCNTSAYSESPSLCSSLICTHEIDHVEKVRSGLEASILLDSQDAFARIVHIDHVWDVAVSKTGTLKSPHELLGMSDPGLLKCICTKLQSIPVFIFNHT
jgi:hypothetical protein